MRYLQVCFLSVSPQGLVRPRASLVLLYPAVSPVRVTAWPEGAELSLPCAVADYTSVAIDWYQDGILLNNSQDLR